MIVVDTNVVSELMRADPAMELLVWADAHPARETHLTAITVAELLYGVARLPRGRRKRDIGDEVVRMVEEDFGQRVLAFDHAAAGHYADIVAQRERAGRPISMADAQIAAICRSHGGPLATRNIDDFSRTGITVINPWDSQ